MVIINLDDNSISILKGSSINNLEKINFFKLPTGIIVDGELKDADKLKFHLSKFVNDYNLKNEKIYLILPERELLIRQITLPKVLSKFQLVESLPITLKKELPFDLNSLYINYILKEDKRHLIVLALKKHFVDFYLEVFSSLSLDVGRVLFPSLGVNLYINKENKNIALIYLGYSYSTMVIYEGIYPVYLSYFNIGIRNLQDMLNLSSEKDFSDSLYLHSDPIFYKWVIELTRTFNSAISQVSLNIEDIYLAGDLDLLLYPEILANYLKEKFSVKVHIQKAQDNLVVDNKLYNFLPLFGYIQRANLVNLNLSLDQIKRDKEELKEYDFIKKSWLVFSVFVLLLFSTFFVSNFLKNRYQHQIQDLQELKKNSQKINNLNTANKLNKNDIKLESVRHIDKFFKVLSSINLKGVSIINLSYDGNVYILEGVCDSVKQLYSYIERLNNSKLFEWVYLKSIAKTKGEYKFFIQLSLIR